MRFLKIKLLLPTAVTMAVPAYTPICYAAETSKCHECCKKRLPKAHELPLYEESHSKSQKIVSTEGTGALEGNISIVRQGVMKYMSALGGYWNQATEAYETGVAHSKSTYDYITQEENIIPRALTIASGGLIGLLFASRGGVFKRLTYCTVGVTSVAAACYPKEAKEYTRSTFSTASKVIGSTLKEHTGYDIEKISSDTEKKLDSFKGSMSMENITNVAKSWSKKIYPADKMGSNGTDEAKNVGDIGQSNPKDTDLYTTRNS